MIFREKIVKLRKLKGLTQDEFASAVGVSRQAVYKWESGQSYPEVAKLLEIKLLFNISIDDLLDDNYEVIVPEKKKKKRLPKAQRAAIEAEVEAQEPTEQTVVEEVKEEPVSVAAVVAEEEEPVSNEPAEAPAEEIKEAPVAAEPAPAEETKKKPGFFARLFGRK